MISKHRVVGKGRGLRSGYMAIETLIIDNEGEEAVYNVGMEIGVSIRNGTGRYIMRKKMITRLSEKGPDALIEVDDIEFLVKWVIDILESRECCS